MPRNRKLLKARAKSWKHRKRPPTIGRALLLSKVHRTGTVKQCIEDIRDKHGIDIAVATFCSWLDGWSAPSGAITLSECGTYLKKSTRCCISEWAGIQHESWWWKLVGPESIVSEDIDDPFAAFDLRPPK